MIKEKLPRCMNGGGCPGLRFGDLLSGDEEKVELMAD